MLIILAIPFLVSNWRHYGFNPICWYLSLLLAFLGAAGKYLIPVRSPAFLITCDTNKINTCDNTNTISIIGLGIGILRMRFYFDIWTQLSNWKFLVSGLDWFITKTRFWSALSKRGTFYTKNFTNNVTNVLLICNVYLKPDPDQRSNR